MIHAAAGEPGAGPEERPGSSFFPVVLHPAATLAEAEELAARLRANGASVAVLGSGGQRVMCSKHPPHLLGRHCKTCGADICAACRLEARGKRRCATCAAIERRQVRNRRLRILFSVFLFSVFLYGVARWQEQEESRLDFAVGVDVAIFQFVAEADADHPVLRALNDPAGAHELARIGEFYAREYARYTRSTADAVRIHTFGPWTDTVTPPSLGGPDDPTWKLAWASATYARYWHGLARSHGTDPDDWDARIYLVYGREPGELAADSRGSNRGRIAVTFVALDDPNPAYAQITVAHELGHVFGAADQYDPVTYRAQIPRGLAEPHLEPVYPQRYAEVMAVDLPLSPTREVEVRSLEQVRVGYQTAASFGWIDQEQADYSYRPAPEVIFGPSRAEAPAR